MGIVADIYKTHKIGGTPAEIVKETYLRSKLKPEKFEKGPMSWFDRLLRGQYTSAAVAKELIRASEQGRKPYVKEAAWRGATGREKASYREVMAMAGYDPKTAAILGFAGDVLLDPTTYITFGTTKMGKIPTWTMRVAGKPVLKSAKLGLALSKAPTKIAKLPVVGQVFRMFVSTTGNPQLDALIRKYTILKGYGRTTARRIAQNEAINIAKLSKRINKPIKSVGNEIMNLVEIGRTPARIKQIASHPDIANIALKHRKMYSQILKAEQKVGVPGIKPLGAKRVELLAKYRQQLSDLIKSRKIAKERGLQRQVRRLNEQISLIKARIPQKEVRWVEKEIPTKIGKKWRKVPTEVR